MNVKWALSFMKSTVAQMSLETPWCKSKILSMLTCLYSRNCNAATPWGPCLAPPAMSPCVWITHHTHIVHQQLFQTTACVIQEQTLHAQDPLVNYCARRLLRSPTHIMLNNLAFLDRCVSTFMDFGEVLTVSLALLLLLLLALFPIVILKSSMTETQSRTT